MGINTAVDRTQPGIGFAVGTQTINRVIEQLIAHGEVVRGFLGVTLATVNPGISARFDLGIEEGVLITNVLRDTPAEEAGLEARGRRHKIQRRTPYHQRRIHPPDPHQPSRRRT